MISSQPTLAQNNLNKSQNNYLSHLSKYRDTEQIYQNSKAAYVSFKTAAAKNEVFLKTKDHLIEVDDLYLAYFDYLNETANSLTWQGSQYNNKEDLVTKIKDESDFFSKNKDAIKSASTLEQLPQIATALDNHITSTTNTVIYRILAVYEYTRSNSLYLQFQAVSQKLTDKIKTKSEEGTSTLLSNWLSEINSIDSQANNSLNKAKILTDNTENGFGVGQLDQLTIYTQEANGQTKRSINLFKEILGVI